MPTTKKAKATAVASAAKKSAKKSSSKKVAKAPVKKVAKSAKPIKATAKKAVAKKTVVKKPAAKKTKVVANKTTAVKSPKTVKKVAKPATVKAAKSATKTVAKPVKTANVPKPTMKKPATSTQAVSPKVTSTTTTTTARRPAASGGPSGFAPYREQHNEEYMGDKQLTHFQHILNLWKDQIHADRNIVAKQIRDDSVNFPDPLDRAVVEEEHTLEWRAREREHRLIEKIDQALASIKQGDYGFCEACGAEIGVRRLEARPTATLCIDCKTIDEIREKLSGVTE